MNPRQVKANKRFADELARAHFAAKEPGVEVRLYVDTEVEVQLAHSLLVEVNRAFDSFDLEKTIMEGTKSFMTTFFLNGKFPPWREIELKNGSVIKISIKPELSREAEKRA